MWYIQGDDIRTPDHKDVYKFVRALFVQAQLASEGRSETHDYVPTLLSNLNFAFEKSQFRLLTNFCRFIPTV